jgi:hypothetical protein
MNEVQVQDRAVNPTRTWSSRSARVGFVWLFTGSALAILALDFVHQATGSPALDSEHSSFPRAPSWPHRSTHLQPPLAVRRGPATV